jgi:flagellin
MYTISPGSAASGLAYQLNQNNKNLQRSLYRLSTMKKINSGADDPAGLAMSMKLGVQIRRTEAISTGVSNASSYLQTQDGVLATADSVLKRMSELTTLATDGTKTTDQRALYQIEFANLQQQINGMLSESFNGTAMFRTDSNTTVDNSTALSATISLTGQTMGISSLDLSSVSNLVGTSGINVSTSSAATTAAAAIDTAINNLSSLRATNGSEQNRVGFASDLLDINKLNLEAADSRIVDLDLAAEMVNYSKYSFLEDAGWALMAQANSKSEKILKLLE